VILVTGAGGKTGQAVVRALVTRGERPRALVHRSEQVDPLLELGAGEVTVGDLLDPSSLEPIFSAIRAVYHIGPNVHPAEVEMGRNVVATALASRVSHFVMHSVLQPRIRAMPHHWRKHLVEEQVVGSGMAYSIIQPASYMQNVRGVWAEVVEGRFPVPYPTDVRFSPVDLTDVAEVAAKVLTGSGHGGESYELCGPELLTSIQMAAEMTEALGWSVEAVELRRDRWLRDTEVDAARAETLLKMFEYYSVHGFFGESQALAGLLGREPNTFSDYLRRPPFLQDLSRSV
jgi:uncharacterized protein YbjT (DUF2867 family)